MLEEQSLIDVTSSEGADTKPIQSVPIEMLVVGDSPRFTGEDVAHTQRLMDVADELPPIIVHRSTMRVIDGIHRLRAAQLAGRDAIDVRFFDGSDDSAFVMAVETNVRHGLPLSAAERRAAAAKIMASHSGWSDRRIAAVAGLSAATVADIRSQSAAMRRSGEIRLGRDGRVRRTDAASGRRLAGRLVAERPEASLREIARIVGISPETVRDVRDRLGRGEDPVPQGRRNQRRGDSTRHDVSHPRSQQGRVVGRIRSGQLSHAEQAAIVQALRRDPSLRFSEGGRLLLRWLEVSQAAVREWDGILRGIPSHRVQQVARLARSCAEDWVRLADQVSSQAASQPSA
jgi:ParB-like chromosome segregation protein Spo0J